MGVSYTCISFVSMKFLSFFYICHFCLFFYKILSEFSTFLLYTFSLAVARFPRQSGVKTRIHLIEVLTVQLILERLESFTESLEVYHFSRPQEPDRIRNLRNIPHNPQDIVVGAPCFLFRSHALKHIRDRIPLRLELAGVKRNPSRRLRPDPYSMIHIIIRKSLVFNLFHSEVGSQLVDDRGYHFEMSEFFGRYVGKNRHADTVRSSKTLGEVTHRGTDLAVRATGVQ